MPGQPFLSCCSGVQYFLIHSQLVRPPLTVRSCHCQVLSPLSVLSFSFLGHLCKFQTILHMSVRPSHLCQLSHAFVSQAGPFQLVGPLFLTQSVRSHLVPCYSMPLYWSPNACHPNPYLGKPRISLGLGNVLRMCLCTLNWCITHQKVLLSRFIYVLGAATKHYINLLLVLNPLYY